MSDMSLVTPVLIAALLSLWGFHHLWRSPESITFKIFMSVFLLIPFLGPLFYFFIAETPDKLPDNEIKRKGGLLGGIFGNFGRNYESSNQELEEDIKKLSSDENDPSE